MSAYKQPIGSNPLKPSGERVPGVLLVEDDAQLMELNRKVLQREGFRVFEATSEQSALWLWQRHNREIDVVLTDVMIPERTTGVELVKKLRGQRADLRAVFTSGFAPELGGVDSSAGFLPKPYTLRELVDATVSALEQPMQAVLARAEIARCLV